MILLIDNTKNIEQAKMTPNIIDALKKSNSKYLVISKKSELINIIEKKRNVAGIILSGGPLCLTDGCSYNDISKNILALNFYKDIPILGICFGFQIMCDVYGCNMFRLSSENKCIKTINIENCNLKLMKDLNETIKIFFCHNDYLKIAPVGFNSFSYEGMVMGIENLKIKRYGFQFHPEGTNDGKEIINNFIQLCN